METNNNRNGRKRTHNNEQQQQQRRRRRQAIEALARHRPDASREIYDQNRNLSLDDDDEKKFVEQQQVGGELGRATEAGHRVSPILSLASSDCTIQSTSASSSTSTRPFQATTATMITTSTERPSSDPLGTAQTSQASSSSGSTQLVESTASSVTADDHRRAPASEIGLEHRRETKDNRRNSESRVLIDMLNLADRDEQPVEATNEYARLAGVAPDEPAKASDEQHKALHWLFSQIGRRAGLLSGFVVRLVGRRSAATESHARDQRRRSPRFNDLQCANGVSLQVPSTGRLRRTSSAASSFQELPMRGGTKDTPSITTTGHESLGLTTTVAGVGGTVTTVTRKKRKTAPLPRLVGKNGQVNLFFDNIDRRQYFRDLFVTMIDIKWRYNLAAAAFGFVLSWLFFACIWYVVLYMHDDLNHEQDPSWSPCIVNVHSFAAALLFSIETQSTLGFGSRIIGVECPGAIVIFCTQLIFGVVIECLIVGMVFAKLARPAKRSQTIMYSKYATICLREDQLCLTFRVGDVRSKSHIIGATIRASLVSQKITREGEIIPFCHTQLNVTIDNSESLLLIWPVTIVHVIDQSSPFYDLSSDQLANFKFELITVLEGTVESTGQSIQVRSSYLPSEVKWGHRFEPIVSAHGFGRYAQTIIDYNKFNRIVQVDTPTCSAREYHARRNSSSLDNLSRLS